MVYKDTLFGYSGKKRRSTLYMMGYGDAIATKKSINYNKTPSTKTIYKNKSKEFKKDYMKGWVSGRAKQRKKK